MVRQPVRLALLIGALVAMAATPAWANHRSRNNCCSPAPSCCNSGTSGDCGNAAPAAPAAAPCTRTVMVTECVPETYTKCVTKYRNECRTEEYTCVRNVMVPETRTRCVTTYTRVPEMRTETRKCWKTVQCCEDRVVTCTTWKTVQETVMQKRLVSLGHWETREECVPDHLANLRNRLGSFGGGRGCGHGHGCGNSCGNSCDPCATTCSARCTPCPAYKTVCRKHWVCCPQYECCPVTVCKKVACCEQRTVKVNVCKRVCEDVQVQVCCYKCVPCTRTETYCVNVCKQVCEKRTRQVNVCVPYQENVTCTRMVSRCVAREVPVAPCCPTTCCPTTCCPTNNCCNNDCCDPCGRGGRLRGLFSGFGGGRGGCCGHNHGCNSGCCR